VAVPRVLRAHPIRLLGPNPDLVAPPFENAAVVWVTSTDWSVSENDARGTTAEESEEKEVEKEV
jgi:hypothetical protein